MQSDVARFDKLGEPKHSVRKFMQQRTIGQTPSIGFV